MRIGIVGFLHESNTFSSVPTDLQSFRDSLFVTGEDVRSAMQDAHHEVGGFFQAADESEVTAVPLVMARALPSGTIDDQTFWHIVDGIQQQLTAALPLDGLLVAPHGATVSEHHPDADGFWLQQVRAIVGSDLPIIGTFDSHANLSPAMVDCCQALIGYGTNPHVDQRERGIEVGRLLVRTLRGEICPTMQATFPPMAISIDRQCTDEQPLKSLVSEFQVVTEQPGVLSTSLVLGFPYADVPEMGSAAVVVTDNDHTLARELADRLAGRMWDDREQLGCHANSVSEAIAECSTLAGPICLLDMGDNVGGGSSADGTELLRAVLQSKAGAVCAALFDPDAVQTCKVAGKGVRIELPVGAKVDRLHGTPLQISATIRSFHDGRFRESAVRHGGITEFDQGASVICDLDDGSTVLLTSRRMVPFSLAQLTSCGIDPLQYRFLIAKGVNAPIAAYQEVCNHFVRVNTPGSTCADMTQLSFQHRRRPMFPFEPDAVWPHSGSRTEQAFR